MIAHRHEVSVQRRGFRGAARLAAQHAQGVGGVPKRRVRPYRRLTGLGAHSGGREDGRRGRQSQRDRQIIAVRQPRGQRPHRLNRGAIQKTGVQSRHFGEHLDARRPQGRRKVIGQVIEETVPEQARDLLEGRPAGQLIQGMAANDQPTRQTVHL